MSDVTLECISITLVEYRRLQDCEKRLAALIKDQPAPPPAPPPAGQPPAVATLR